MRSCGPECRWIFIRIAAAGRLNSVPPTLTGSLSGAFAPPAPQVGHSR